MAEPAPFVALYSHEAEQAILGLLMTTSTTDGVGPARLLLERENLHGGDFHLPAHAAVYTASQALLGAHTPVDPVSAFERARSQPAVIEAGGLKWLFEVHRTADALLPESYPNLVRQVRELAVRRKLVHECRVIAQLAQDMGQDVGDVLQASARRVAEISFRRDTFQTLTQVLDGIQRELIKSNDSTASRLIPTGIGALDRLIGGLPPLLVVVGGRPGAGKSAIAASLTESLAANGKKVGVFSLEDRAPWLGYRLLAGHSGVENQTLRFQKLNAAQWERVGEGFHLASHYSDMVLVDDRRSMTGPDICQSARNMIVNHGCQALLIDHLLEVKPTSRHMGRRDLEVAETLSGFRDIANEYGLPVVVFTQLNRGADGKAEPNMKDFKDAGAVEEMARVAIALQRDGDTISVCVIKNTNGVLGRVDVPFHGAAAMLGAEKQEGLFGRT